MLQTASHTSSSALAWSGSASLPRRIGIVIAASAFVAICAHISIPLPFTTVPLTLQPFAVLLVGFLLSPLDAFLALTIYLAEGVSGLPVFTPSGPGGMLQILGPNGGFLLSYPLAAAVAATIFRTLSRHIRSFGAASIAGTVAIALIFTSGATWFGTVLHANLHTVWIGAIAPFLPGEVVKIFAAAGIASALTQKRG